MVSTPPKHTHSITKDPLADCGATDPIFRESDIGLLHNVTKQGGKQVTYPDGNTATSIGTGKYTTKGLPPIDVTIFEDKDLRQSLVAMNNYTKQGYAAILTDDAIHTQAEYYEQT